MSGGGAFGSFGVRYRVHSGLRPRMVGALVNREVGGCAPRKPRDPAPGRGARDARETAEPGGGRPGPQAWTFEHLMVTGDEAGGA